MKAAMISRRVNSSGRPPFSASMLTPKLVCSARVAVELVEHDVGLGVALQFDDDAQALAVALVAQIGDAVDQLLANGLGDALDQLRLVDLVRQLGEDDRLAILADLLDMGFRRA